MSECHFCGEDGALDRHHIVPKRHGGSDNDENLVTVCPTCHRKLENLYDKRFYGELVQGGERYDRIITGFFDRCVCIHSEGEDYSWVDAFDTYLRAFDKYLAEWGMQGEAAEWRTELLSAFHELPQADVVWHDGGGSGHRIEIHGPNPVMDAGGCVKGHDRSECINSSHLTKDQPVVVDDE